MVRLITLFLLFCLCSFAASAMPDDPPGIAAAKLLAQRKVDTAAFNNFASICIAADSTALLMDTYRKLLENGQKDIDDADLPFLNALHARINPLHYKYIDFYLVMLLHLDIYES